MNKEMYLEIEKYMLTCMNDGAHDRQHIYRVLYTALDLAEGHTADMDVLIAAAMLHDIGRDAQFKDQKCDHAIVGSEMAYKYLIGIGWDVKRAIEVSAVPKNVPGAPAGLMTCLQANKRWRENGGKSSNMFYLTRNNSS